MIDRINTYCPERIEDSDKEYPKPVLDRAVEDIANLAIQDGFLRLEDYMKYSNEQSINRIKNFEKYDDSYAMNVAIEMSRIEERDNLIEYIKDKQTELLEDKRAI